MWRLKALPRLTLPDAVFLKRFFAPEWVFSLYDMEFLSCRETPGGASVHYIAELRKCETAELKTKDLRDFAGNSAVPQFTNSAVRPDHPTIPVPRLQQFGDAAGGGVNDVGDLTDLAGRKAAQFRVFVDEGFVFREVDAESLVLGDEALLPLNARGDDAQGFVRLGGCSF